MNLNDIYTAFLSLSVIMFSVIYTFDICTNYFDPKNAQGKADAENDAQGEADAVGETARPFLQIQPVSMQSLQTPSMQSMQSMPSLPSQKNAYKLITNLNEDAFYNKLIAMHEMKIHHELCSNMLSSTPVKMNLSLEDIIATRKSLRYADVRMRKYMKKASQHPLADVLNAIYYNYDIKKLYNTST